MILPLIKQNIKSCIRPLLIVWAVIMMYTAIIVYMYNPQFSRMLTEYQKIMPGIMDAMGMSGAAENLVQWMGIYLYGFIMTAFPMIFSIIAANSLMMKYIDSGSVCALLTSGRTRRQIVLTQAVCAVVFVLVLFALSTAGGVVCARIMFGGQLDINLYIQLNFSCMLMQLMVMCVSFAAACFSSETKQFCTFGAGLPVAFYIADMAANMGGKAENIKYLTPYTLFDAAKITAGESVAVQNALMAVISLALVRGAAVYFEKRDMSV